MTARKKIEPLALTASSALKARLERTGASPPEVLAMLKDLHLIEAALASDGLVASRDEQVRHLFAAATITVPQLREVVWVNPDKDEEEALAWLLGGARPEPSRKLGRRE